MIGDCQVGSGGHILKEVSDLFGWMPSASSKPLPNLDNAQIWGHLEFQRQGEYPFSARQGQAPSRHQAASEQQLEDPQAGPARKVQGGSTPSDTNWTVQGSGGGFPGTGTHTTCLEMSMHCPLSHWLQPCGQQGRGLANSPLACSPGLRPAPDVQTQLGECGSGMGCPKEPPPLGLGLSPDLSESCLLLPTFPMSRDGFSSKAHCPKSLSGSGLSGQAHRTWSQTNCNSNSGPVSGTLPDLGQVSCLPSASVSSSTRRPNSRYSG